MLKSEYYDDIYFSSNGGLQESEFVFLKNNNLPEAFKNKDEFVIGELGFGTGLNFLLTMRMWKKYAEKDAKLTYISIEKHPLYYKDIIGALGNFDKISLYLQKLILVYADFELENGLNVLKIDNNIELHLYIGDVMDMLPKLDRSVDCWFLDGFAPAKNPDMWSDEVLTQIFEHSHKGSSFSTYTSAGFVRRKMQQLGFKVEKIKGHGNKRTMLSGIL